MDFLFEYFMLRKKEEEKVYLQFFTNIWANIRFFFVKIQGFVIYLFELKLPNFMLL